MNILLQCPCCSSGGWIGWVLAAAGIWLLWKWIQSLLNSKGNSMNKTVKILIGVGLIAAIAVVFAVKEQKQNPSAGMAGHSESAALPAGGLPRLLDLGAGKCIPCKMMAPILESLKNEYAGQFDVVFIDVWEHQEQAQKYNIRMIPTQIFFDPSGKELFRHEGFFSKEDILAKWKELGFDFSRASGQLPVFERWTPAQPDLRPKEQVCYLCDKDIDPQTLVVVQTEKGPVRLCSPHCYFILYSCLTEDKTDFEKKVSVTDFARGGLVPLPEAVFLVSADERGRPVIWAYGQRADAEQDRQKFGGNILSLAVLQENELSHRCGFCDRACYPQDAAEVLVEGWLRTWGCCSHCALGVAARTGKDIEVHEKDRLTGEPIVVRTMDGSILSIEPPTAVAWFGMKQKPDGTWGSAGCFHQGFFVNAENLKKWVEQNPYETGKLISIHQALADKMKLSPEQIQKACKIGECTPK
jgi:thioredoxin 1